MAMALVMQYQCPNTPSGESVNANGCAQSQMDDDADGISNAQDQCPNTNNGNTVDVNGCTVVIQDTVDESEEEEDSSPLPGFTALIASLSVLLAVGYRKLKMTDLSPLLDLNELH